WPLGLQVRGSRSKIPAFNSAAGAPAGFAKSAPRSRFPSFSPHSNRLISKAKKIVSHASHASPLSHFGVVDWEVGTGPLCGGVWRGVELPFQVTEDFSGMRPRPRHQGILGSLGRLQVCVVIQ